uniref:Uncharacterized protein n=1 Tax=viral metagenome TaxID=1070528 RepID=A0A6M3KV49_9ZZZZ
MEEENKENINWLEIMIERQALPEEVREGTNTEFCQKLGIAHSTYYYQASKPENQKRIIDLSIQNARKYAPTVLDNLGQRAKTDNKATEMYLKFILQLAENLNLNPELPFLFKIVKDDGNTRKNSETIPETI